ncbi:hypothetical protein HWV62_2725 [Athelia sp. TMB]|nr:hypothetical protein HWV62_2725 [Athelia sp. TMB]
MYVPESALTGNIRIRRGSKVAVNLPMFPDQNVPQPFIDPTIPWDRAVYPEDSDAKNGAALPNHIYLDAKAFGGSCCCLQVTVQGYDIDQARRLYDAMVPLGPIMLALTAASPVWRGYLADIDCRWNAIVQGIDDRTEEERGLKDWMTYYTIDQDDATSNDHFENIQSTNWQSVRFKPPPPNSDIGWRVEFRTMEVQMTDFENAAFSMFMILLTRAVLAFNLNFYVPISKVDENMQRAHILDACRSQTFFFRKKVFPPEQTAPTPPVPSDCSPSNCSDCASVNRKEAKIRNCFPALPRPVDGVNCGSIEDEYEEMSMEEIMNGKFAEGNAFPGLLNLINAYIDSLEVTEEERRKIGKYLDFIKQRSNGSLQTPATWIRNFIRSHPKYKFDSVVSEEINYDLVVAVDEIVKGTRRDSSLLPEDYNAGAIDEVILGL